MRFMYPKEKVLNLTDKLGVWLRSSAARLTSRFHINENTAMILMAVVIGVLAGCGNYAFRRAIDFFHWALFEQGQIHLGISLDSWNFSRLLIVFMPAIGGVLLIPFGIWFKRDLAFGFPAFLEKVNLRGAKLKLRTIFTRGLASAITLGTGGSAGQEGPIAQIGGAIGSQFGQSFRVSGDRLKILVACGVASGVAATFNAPIAGVFFAQEIVLLASFELSSFTSIVIASGMATVVSRALVGDISEIYAPSYTMHSFWELGLYVLLGLLIGLLAALFIDVHFKIKDRFTALKMPRLLKPVFGGFLVGVIGLFAPEVFGNGYDFIQKALLGEGVWYLLALLIVLKMLATSITLGCGLQGGLFAPCLYLGAVTGGAFGKLANMLFGGLSTGAYAVVGMGAFLAAATHAPMTAIFLLFEITDSYQVIVPIMVTCVIAAAVCRHFKPDSIETVELRRAGIDLESGKERNIMKSIRVGDVMVRELETIPENMTLGQFADFIASNRHTNFPLLDGNGEMSGIISVQDFMGVVFEKELMDLVVVKELATLDVITVTPDDNLDQAMKKIGFRNIEQLPVVIYEGSRKLVGIVSRRDMVTAYNRVLMSRTLEEEQRVASTSGAA